jgi:acyl-CoA thioester hydrolase
MKVWYPIQIRFRDLDPLAHVNNAVYFTYFEEARASYFAQLRLEHWPSAEEEQAFLREDEEVENQTVVPTTRILPSSLGTRYGSLIKENTCTYNLPLIVTDKAEIGVEVTNIGRTSFQMELQVRDSLEHARIFATGRTIMVWCNYKTGRPTPVPPLLRNALEQMEGHAFPLSK